MSGSVLLPLNSTQVVSEGKARNSLIKAISRWVDELMVGIFSQETAEGLVQQGFFEVVEGGEFLAVGGL